MPGTLYLTRNGLLEPLGQSQVMGYLKGLSQDYQITLITFEKTEDLADTQAMAQANADCEAHGIDWRSKIFHQRPKLLAPAWCMFEIFWSALHTKQVSGDRSIIGWRPRTTQPKYWIDMPQRFFLLISLKSYRAHAFGCDLIARILAHFEVRSRNTHGEGRTCAA